MTPLWTPTEARQEASQMRRYMRWLEARHGFAFDGYRALWEWSVADIEAFWRSIWAYFEVRAAAQPDAILGGREMPGAVWFPGARLNYTEQVFKTPRGDAPALIACAETRGLDRLDTVTWAELERQVDALANALVSMGVGVGDCVAAFVPNIPEAVIAFLASAKIGAIWSSCSPDMGSAAVLDRFTQIEPKVLVSIDGYLYNGKVNDRRAVVAELVAALPTLTHVIAIPYLFDGLGPLTDHARAPRAQMRLWADCLTDPAPRAATPVPFEHPLWVLYSSGTTGLPKPIVHSQGGIVLEHLKSIALHCDLGPGDRFFWFTTTGWMMWNFLLGGLLAGSSVVLYDGSPAAENMAVLWQLAERAGVTLFGASAAYVAACMKSGVEPARFDLSALRTIGSTGSPLPEEGFDWIYAHVKRDVWLVSLSGGTDVCTAFVGGCPLWPVYRGEIQARCLGADVQALDEQGALLHDAVGELVLRQPMPSMPVFFWNDAGMRRYRESYFEHYPGLWRHGDWVRITPRDGLVIYGRSDSTINRHGVRVGTSELYRAIEAVPDVLDSLIVDLESLGRASYLPLFVVLREGVTLDDALKQRINDAIRLALSARQIPDEIFQIAEVPRTLNGKKMEVPVRKILLGVSLERAATPGSMANPAALDYFVALAARLRRAR
jgi:acetoacetyl-CoA synthetase